MLCPKETLTSQPLWSESILQAPDLEIQFVSTGLLHHTFPIGYIMYGRKTN